MIRKALHKLKRYCSEELSNIENYQEALESPELYDLHHKLGLIYSKNELLENGLYYNRPAAELIFLSHTEHAKLHSINRVVSEETRQKISIGNKGKSTWIKDTHRSEETKSKISNSLKGHLPYRTGPLPEEAKQKLRKPKLICKWLTPAGEIKEMALNHAKRYHPDWVRI